MTEGPNHEDLKRIVSRKPGGWQFPEGWNKDPRNKSAAIRDERMRDMSTIAAFIGAAVCYSQFLSPNAPQAGTDMAEYARFIAPALLGIAAGHADTKGKSAPLLSLGGTLASLASSLGGIVLCVKAFTPYNPELVQESAIAGVSVAASMAFNRYKK